MREVFSYDSGFVAVDLSQTAACLALRKVRDFCGEWPNRLRVSSLDEEYAQKILKLIRPLLEELELIVDYRLPEFSWELFAAGYEGFGSEGA